MAVLLRALLIITGLTGIHSITTVSQVSVKAGDSISIPCLYGSQYLNHVKYLCKGYRFPSCSYAIKTNQQNTKKYSISDDKSQRIFTVTINDLTDEDTNYWCTVEINNRVDDGRYFQLSVTTGTPSLYVDSQQITGFKGDDVTIKCNYRNRGQMEWCRLGKSCVMPPSGSIDGTGVTIDNSVSNVFTVTMSGLRTESSGWYWCVKGGFQMPVYVTVTEQPTTTTVTTTTESPTPEPVTTVFADGPTTTVQSDQDSIDTVDLKGFIIPLSVLIFIVIVTLCIFFMLRRRKQTKEAAAMELDNEIFGFAPSTHAEAGVTYSTVQHKRKTSKQRPQAESDVDVTYSNVDIMRQQRVRRGEGSEDNVTYSILA